MYTPQAAVYCVSDILRVCAAQHHELHSVCTYNKVWCNGLVHPRSLHVLILCMIDYTHHLRSLIFVALFCKSLIGNCAVKSCFYIYCTSALLGGFILLAHMDGT